MSTTHDSLLEALLDSWNRHNTILINLLRALPEGGLEARAMEGSPTIEFLYSHIHETRYFWLSKTAPEFAKNLPDLFRQEGEHWLPERDPERIAPALEESARAVGEAVKNAVMTGQEMKSTNVAYDHPVLLLQHMLWHEGYHVGQMMLGLKAMGRPMPDEQAEPLIWDVWRREW
jgi:uncharacterized damage-inducible protein DinB